MTQNKKKLQVGYYTSTNFLDAAIETIQCLKSKVDLHLFIEITMHSQKSTIVNIDDISKFNLIEKPESIFGVEQWLKIQKYFEGLSSVQFVVFKHRKNFSFNTLYSGLILSKYLRKLNLNIVHFDTISLRAIGMIKFLRRKKVVITLHDAIPHSGEQSWKEKLLSRLYYSLASCFIFYSEYSLKEFKKLKDHKDKFLTSIYLQPYTYYSTIQRLIPFKENFILFFGRLSYYKGIDILLDAIPIVLKKYPNQLFYIIGKKVNNFEFNKEILKTNAENIITITDFIPSDLLIQFIKESKFIVCPYRDATQSGVLMTSKALGKITIATDVGAFREYISDGYDGFLCSPNAQSLAEKIIEAIENNKYKELEYNINSNYSYDKATTNSMKILECYLN